MRIKMLKHYPVNGKMLHYGEEHDLDSDDAKKLIKLKKAVQMGAEAAPGGAKLKRGGADTGNPPKSPEGGDLTAGGGDSGLPGDDIDDWAAGAVAVTIGELAGMLPSVGSLDALKAMLTAERNGESRVGALSAIQDQITAMTK